MTEAELNKLQADVKRFLSVYQNISPEAKAQFEAQMNSTINNLDEKTKALYLALLQAAKDGEEVEEAIKKMKKQSELTAARLNANHWLNNV